MSALGADTYLKTGDAAIVTLAADSLGTAGDKKITGLTSGIKYKVTIGAIVLYAKADGTLSPNLIRCRSTYRYGIRGLQRYSL